MLRFVITPEDRATPSEDVVSPDAAGVLQVIEKLGCTAADVGTGGVHLFSAMLAGNGLWSISNCTIARRRNVRSFHLMAL